MAFLEIVHITGEVERRELSKQTPLSIGSHRSNDIRIDEADVDIMHCRVAWAKDAFEAVSAGTMPFEVNGAPVMRAKLKAGDVLRFGTVDIRYRDSDQDGAGKAAKPSAKAADTKAKPAPPKPSKKVDNDLDFLDDDDFEEVEDDGPPDFSKSLDALAAAEKKGSSSPAPKKPEKAEKPKESKPATAPAKAVAAKSDSKPTATSKPAGKTESKPATSARRYAEARPGEEDLIRSPLVLTLGGAALALLLTGAIFWFLAFRYSTEAEFNQAKQIYDEGNFRGAIIELDNFGVAHPKDPLAVQAKQLAGMARIRQHTESAAPNYSESMKYLRQFVNEQRDREDFETVHPDIFDQSKKVAIGAAQLAGKNFDLDLIKISGEAKTMLKTYAPKDVPPTETLEQIEAEVRKSEASILEKGVYDEHLASMRAALGVGAAPSTTEGQTQPAGPVSAIKAMQIRQDLLTRYPKYATDKKISDLMTQALQAEQTAVSLDNAETPAEQADREALSASLALLFQGRTRVDEVSVGQSVVAVAQDCCYGMDLVTGAPVWRRPRGLESPFFPLIDTATSRVVYFDTRYNELVCVEQHKGTFQWRQATGARVRGTPLLSEGTIYATTDAGEVLAVELDSGRIRERLKFSQPVTSAAEIKSGKLVVAGHEDVLYELTKRPLSCTKVHYLGQPSGSVQAPLSTMGSYLLMIENGGANSKLRLLETNTGENPFAEVATGQVTGRVFDEPVIRGRDLFIPSTGERVSTFSVSDDPGQPPLTPGPNYQGKGGDMIPIHMLPGPDRQLWIATVALARLRLTTDALQPDGTPVAPGVSTQPLVYEAGYLFNARNRAFTDSVTLTRTDRDEMTSDWQAVLGSRALAWTQSGDQLLCVNDAGVVFRIGDRQWKGGGFYSEAASRLPVSEDLITPLRATSMTKGRLAIVAGDPEPKAWIIGPSGQIEGSPLLPAAPEADPVMIGERLVVPLAGRLHAVKLSAQSAIQDLVLPTGEVHPWQHIVATGADRAVAVTKDGILLQVRLESSGRGNLAEAGRIELGAPVTVNMGADAQLVAVVDTTGRLTVLGAEQFDQIGQRQLPQPSASPPSVVSGLVLVESGRQELHAIAPEADLPTRWTLPLAGATLQGALITPGGLLIALQSGQVVLVNPESGEVLSRWDVGSPLAMGPTTTSFGTLLSTLDNTVFAVPLMGGSP